MTGQVKEGVLIRWAELGVEVRGGCLRFDPVLLDPAEFLTESTAWDALGASGSLPAGSLGFTYCTVPVVYSLGSTSRVELTRADGTVDRFEAELDAATSRAVFERSGAVTRIDVTVDRDRLLAARIPDALDLAGTRFGR